MADIFAVGSINQDFVLKVERRPEPGETVTNACLSLHNGGKGANQAAAAALLGAAVAMLGRVGDDGLGGPLVVNEHEAAFLLDAAAGGVEGVDGALAAAPKLLEIGPRSAVITLGAAGAVYAGGDATEHVSSPEVEVVDTTGAGDAFVGALAVRLAEGASLGEAVAYAVRAGAAAVTQEGAQGSLPTPETVEAV